MKELIKNQSHFYNKWTIQRRNKWKYLMTHGTIYWLLFGLIILTTLTIHGGNGHPWRWLLTFLLIAGTGIYKANDDFNRNEEIYQTYFEDDPGIVQGVILLESGNQWIWENLTLYCEEVNILIIRNNLFWLSQEYPTDKQLADCMQTLREDIERLKQNKEFSNFAENKKIKLQLFNNQTLTHPLLEELIN